ncbi:hypothetical protein ABE488_09185 [Luteimonas sp. TWI662]|uniref:hypothetical protein n=1 Tax=Luteimonas sp. TWI662 TaxID=3136789 RepID=UPI00320872A6
MNDSGLQLLKAAVGGAAAVGAMPAAMEAAHRAERIIAGVPESVLLCAIVGVLVGVLLLPEREADRVTPDASLNGSVARARQMALRLIALGVLLLAYAFVAAWVVSLLPYLMPSLAGAPQLPLAGISGVVVRRLLPFYLQFVERGTKPGAPKP